MFKKAYIATCIQRTSYMEHNFAGICNFEVHDINCSENIEVFHKEYIASRKQLYFVRKWGTWSAENDLGYKNFLMVLQSGNYKLGYYENSFQYRVSPQIKCCGEWLSLHNFTNTCPQCQADYNASGQLLAPRSQWGEETGENWEECY